MGTAENQDEKRHAGERRSEATKADQDQHLYRLAAQVAKRRVSKVKNTFVIAVTATMLTASLSIIGGISSMRMEREREPDRGKQKAPHDTDASSDEEKEKERTGPPIRLEQHDGEIVMPVG